jgi:hypothetical protein
MIYAIKLANRDFSYFTPIRGLPGAMLAIVFRACAILLIDLGFLAYLRHPKEMGCVNWWFGRLWPWLLLVAAIVLRVTTPTEMRSVSLNTTVGMLLGADTMVARLDGEVGDSTTATLPLVAVNGTPTTSVFDGTYTLRNPTVLAAVAAILLVVWLFSLVAFFLLCKREYWPTFWNNETAAEYTKRVKWDGQPNEKLRAMLLVKVHPSLLRLIAPVARIWIHSSWATWTDAPPEWFNDRWKRALPDVVLSHAELTELGGKHRRRSTLAEQLRFQDKEASGARSAVAPAPIDARAALY